MSVDKPVLQNKAKSTIVVHECLNAETDHFDNLLHVKNVTCHKVYVPASQANSASYSQWDGK